MEKDRKTFKQEFKKRVYTWVLSLIRLLERLPNLMTTQVMAKQLMRSGTSVLANYVEASAASSLKDYTNFFNHALKSANESKVWLALLLDTKKASDSEVTKLLEELDEISKILAKSIITMKKKREGV